METALDLKDFKNTSSYDDIKIKDVVKKRLLKNKLILTALNTELDLHTPKLFFNKYILPYYMLVPVQKDINNYICYETSFTEVPKYNDILKYQQITFYIVCSCGNKNIIDDTSTGTGVARHDLLAALIIDEFNWSNYFGFQVHLISDESRPVDNKFCARTLVFEQTTPNSILKNGVVINSAR